MNNDLKAVWQSAHEICRASWRYVLILVQVALLLGGLLVKMVTLSRRTTTQLTSAGELKALSDCFLCLLHD